MTFGKQIAKAMLPAQLICGDTAAAPRWFCASVHIGSWHLYGQNQCFVVVSKSQWWQGIPQITRSVCWAATQGKLQTRNFKAYCALRCWADLLWAPEVGSDCSGYLVLSALIQLHFSLLGTFQHEVSQTEQIKAEIWKISRYL